MDYSKYKFNYFDVVKRHERIINRPKDWEIKVLAIIMLMVTFIYTFTTFGFCVEEEEVELTLVTNLQANTNANYFQTSSSGGVSYCELEKGYIYTIHDERSSGQLTYVFCNNTPAVNVPYYDLGTIPFGSTYSFIVDDSFDYLIIAGNNMVNGRYVTRRPISRTR